MTTQANITAGLTAIATATTTLQNAIDTVINAIVDLNSITPTHKVPADAIPQLNAYKAQLAIIGAGISAVGTEVSGV